MSNPISIPPLHQYDFSKEQMEKSRMDAIFVSNEKQKSPEEIWEETLSDMDSFSRDYYMKNPDAERPPRRNTIFIYQPRFVPYGEEDTFQDYDKLFARGDGSYMIYVRMKNDYVEHEVRDSLADQSLTFFQDAAKRYLAEGDAFLATNFGNAVNGVADFASTIKSFFGYEPNAKNSLTGQIKYVIKELAEQIKSGKGDRLDTLQNQISINSVDFSVSDLMKTIKAVDDITKPLERPGSLNMESCILLGVSVSQMNSFASQNLNEQQAKVVSGAYQKRVQNTLAYQEKIANEYAAANGLNSKNYEGVFKAYHITSKGTASGKVFDLFSSLDTSSPSAYQKSFSDALSVFDTYMLRLRQENQTTDGFRELANKAFGSLQITSNGTNRTGFFSRDDDPKYIKSFAKLKADMASGVSREHYLRPF